METKKQEYFEIKGLRGKKTLKGEMPVYGSKNAALPILASTLLFQDEIKIKNIPNIADIQMLKKIIKKAGVSIRKKGDRSLSFKTGKKATSDFRGTSAETLRASVILTGPVLSRFGKIKFPHPGGCVIGTRPIDFFLDGFKKMGAKVKTLKNYYELEAPKGGLKGVEIFFNVPSVTATETFIMAGVLAKGKTILKNCAMEPEIVDLVKLLKKGGAKIEGEGSPTIQITGGKLLKSKKYTHSIIPDRIEAGSFLILGALSASNLEITNCIPKHLEIVIKNLKEMGVNIKTEKNKIIVKNNKNTKTKNWKSINIKTHEYPGFPTDLQPPMVVLLTQVTGESLVFETIFENRLKYTDGLYRMGADITMYDLHRAIVKGPKKLHAKTLEGPDIRAGLAFLLAAIVASGNSVINNIHYIDRGYEKIEERLKKIGLDIKRKKY